MKTVRRFFTRFLGKYLPTPRPASSENTPELQLGLELHQAGQLSSAAEIFQKILLIKPDHFDAMHHLGIIAHQSGNNLIAANLIKHAIEIDPSSSAAYNNLGVIYKSLGHQEDAEGCFRKSLELDPGYAEALNNLGNIFLDRGNLKEAEECFRKSLANKSDCVEALNNLGNILREFGHAKEAESYYRKALALRPMDPEIQLNLSFSLLSHGNCQEGFALYDSRLNCRQQNTTGASAIYAQMQKYPPWQGEPLYGKRLLIWSEQGVGDTLMFASIFGDVLEKEGNHIIMCDERLVALFERSFPGAEIISQRNALIEIDVSYQIAAGSLARNYRTRLEDFPAHSGYLKAETSQVLYWQRWLSGLGTGLKVGISWRSELRSGLRDRYYTPLTSWREILTIPGVVFINLQYGEAEQELQEAERLGGITIYRPPGLDLKQNLNEAAALTMALDLIISAGTAVAGMAGALGKETWMYTLNSEWDKLGTNYLPWMPSVRIYEKSWDDSWENTLLHIAEDLKKFTPKK